MPSSYELPTTTRAQASIIREQRPEGGFVVDDAVPEPTLTQWGFTPDRSVLAIQKIESGENGLPTSTESALVRFDSTGNVASFDGESDANSLPSPKKFLGILYLVKTADRHRAIAASIDTTTRLIETVFKNFDRAEQ